MAIEFEFNRIPAIINQIDIEGARALQTGLRAGVETARGLVPVSRFAGPHLIDTIEGVLEVDPSGDLVGVVQAGSSAVLYAGEVEWGTGVERESGAPGGPGRSSPWVYYHEGLKRFVTTSGNAPQPYMRPAASVAQEVFLFELESMMGDLA